MTRDRARLWPAAYVHTRNKEVKGLLLFPCEASMRAASTRMLLPLLPRWDEYYNEYFPNRRHNNVIIEIWRTLLSGNAWWDNNICGGSNYKAWMLLCLGSLFMVRQRKGRGSDWVKPSLHCAPSLPMCHPVQQEVLCARYKVSKDYCSSGAGKSITRDHTSKLWSGPGTA